MSVPAQSILGVVVVYIAIAVLLLSLNLTSRWRWWIKGGAIIVTGAFFIFSYSSITALLGWPSSANPPKRFSVVSTHIIEPNAFTDDPGAIYLWLEEIDEDNFIISEPRSYRLPYVEPLAEAVEDAQELLDAGEQVQGEFNEAEQEEAEAGEDADEDGTPGEGGEGGAYYPVDFELIFGDMPPVALPDKGAL